MRFCYVKVLKRLTLQFKHHKWVLDYGKIEWRCGIKCFLSLSNITLLSLLYVTCPSAILKFLQDFLKLAFFPLSTDISSGQYLLLKVFYFSQTIVFIACHLSKIYLQAEREAWFYLAYNVRYFISKTFEFLFGKGVEKSSCSWISKI